MYDFPIGVLIESFRTNMKDALKSASECGVSGIQVSATSGEMTPESTTSEQRAEFVKQVKDNGLVISAVCGDFICGNPNYNFYSPDCKASVLERSKRIVDFSKELGVDIITTHVGVIPADPNSEKRKAMREACNELAEYACKMNAHFAIETGPEIATTLKSFLDSLDSKGIGVNLDPANFIMVTGDDPANAVHTLKDYIVHTHAKDGRRLIEGNPEVIYGEIESEIQEARYFIELPLGEGDVPYARYLKALDDIGYKGFLTIEREIGDNPKADIIKAVEFLKAMKK